VAWSVEYSPDYVGPIYNTTDESILQQMSRVLIYNKKSTLTLFDDKLWSKIVANMLPF